MKQQTQNRFAGVWLDNQQAMIITSGPETAADEYSILDKVQATGIQGGGSEHSMNNAKKTGHLKYFKALSNLLLRYDEILLFGPGQSQEQFQNHLQDDAQFKSKQITIDSSDQMTDPQRIAKVRDFFKGRQS
jgi:stalled ribosome rescue protein Dom34